MLSQPPDLMECKMAAIMFNVDLPFFPLFIHLFPSVPVPPAPPSSTTTTHSPLLPPCERQSRRDLRRRKQLAAENGRRQSEATDPGEERAASGTAAALIESFLLLKREKKGERSRSVPPAAWRTAGQWRRRASLGERLQLATPGKKKSQHSEESRMERVCEKKRKPRRKGGDGGIFLQMWEESSGARRSRSGHFSKTSMNDSCDNCNNNPRIWFCFSL